MMKILIFGGTSEAHRLSDELADRKIEHTLSVATEYGEQILKGNNPVRKVLTGRMDDRAIHDLIVKDGYQLVIDATHPYATEVTNNIIKAIKDVNEEDKERVRGIRLGREEDSRMTELAAYRKAYFYKDIAEAAETLKSSDGNILFTTGSKDLGTFAGILGKENLPRAYARVIPSADSIRACEDAGIETAHIIAMQGPFDRELNEAMIRQYEIRHLVTKDSGKTGGLDGKVSAAMSCDISIHIISRPADNKEMETAGYKEVLDLILKCSGSRSEVKEGEDIGTHDRDSIHSNALKISLIGMGMGGTGNITREAYREIENADIILGSSRLTEICRKNIRSEKAEYAPIYKADEIVRYIDTRIQDVDSAIRGSSVVVLFSGDSGFNSGCRDVYKALDARRNEGLEADVRIYPGISSVSYLAARLARPYEDAYITSMHGKGEDSIYRTAAHVRTNSDVYALTGSAADIIKLANVLKDAGLGECMISAACDLSYPGERIITEKAEIIAAGNVLKESEGEKPLFTCHIFNPAPIERRVSAGLAAAEFIRGSVPMTKEEVRTVTIDKLRLGNESRVLDLGCGTGSVTVEIAGLIPDGIVFSYDSNDDAVKLTRENLFKHKLPNVIVRKGTVPEILSGETGCPKGITHAFIGGSKGSLPDILDCLKEISARQETDGSPKGIRVVINVITDKTGDDLRAWTDRNEITDREVVRCAVCRGDEMIPENEVYIYSFTL